MGLCRRVSYETLHQHGSEVAYQVRRPILCVQLPRSDIHTRFASMSSCAAYKSPNHFHRFRSVTEALRSVESALPVLVSLYHITGVPYLRASGTLLNSSIVCCRGPGPGPG